MSQFIKKKDAGDPFTIQEGRFKEGELKDFSYRREWTEDSFIPQSKYRELVGRVFNFQAIFWTGLFFALALGIVFFRLFWLQAVKGDYYYSLAEGNRIRIERLEARRGVIYDRAGLPLVENVANFMLYVVPSDLPKGEAEREVTLKRIAVILGAEEPVQAAREKLLALQPGAFAYYQPLFIADNIEYEKAVKLRLESAAWKGVQLSSKSGRKYNLCGENGCAFSLSHLLGYAGKISETELLKYGSEYTLIDYIGKTGLENFYEADLRGRHGEKYIEIDALGKEKKVINQTKEEDGKNIVLSLDASLQTVVENILKRNLSSAAKTKAAVVGLDPRNGEILFSISWPAFDNNDFSAGIAPEKYKELISDKNLPLFNRVVSGEYPSGSTFKPVVAVAALEEGVINEKTSFLSVGGLSIDRWFFPDWKIGGHGITDVRRALAESINTFFYYVGGGYGDFFGLGLERMVKYAKDFGLGAQSGVDLGGEATGFLPTKEWKEETQGEVWYIGDTYHLSIGQGYLLVTPLQVANFTAAIANGGRLYRPHLVKKILSGDERLLAETDASPVKSGFVSAENLEIVRQGMRQAVVSGSARQLADLPVKVAGKTGTAQWGSNKDPHAWFTGFAPYDNPEIAFTVLVEEGVEGSGIATRIAREILIEYFRGK